MKKIDCPTISRDSIDVITINGINIIAENILLANLTSLLYEFAINTTMVEVNKACNEFHVTNPNNDGPAK